MVRERGVRGGDLRRRLPIQCVPSALPPKSSNVCEAVISRAPPPAHREQPRYSDARGGAVGRGTEGEGGKLHAPLAIRHLLDDLEQLELLERMPGDRSRALGEDLVARAAHLTPAEDLLERAHPSATPQVDTTSDGSCAARGWQRQGEKSGARRGDGRGGARALVMRGEAQQTRPTRPGGRRQQSAGTPARM